MRPIWRRAAALTACCVAGWGGPGCSSNFNETHYFKSVNRKGEPVNYYRLKVSGYSLLSSSRYLSGYFDETAVDAYFSEFVQPGNGTFPATRPAPATEAGSAAGGAAGSSAETAVRSLNRSLEDRSLLLLLTSNTDAVAEGIQSLAQNEAVAATLSRIISRDRIAASREAAGELERATTDARSTAAAGDRLLLGLPEAPAQPQAQQALLDYANRLIVYLGDQPVDTLDKAATWLTDNRARLRARYLEE